MNITRSNTTILTVKVTDLKILIKYSTLSDDILVNSVFEEKQSSKPLNRDFAESIASLSKYLRKVHYLNEEDKNVIATGFVVHDTSIILTGKLRLKSERIIAINSDLIDLDNDTYGFENDLNNDIEIVTGEAYSYLFEGKSDQVKIEFKEEEEEIEKGTEKEIF